MKTPETPIEDLRGLVPKPPETREDKPPPTEFVPRYVELPARRRHRDRNLGWGVASGVTALVLIALAVLLSGPPALLAPAVAVMTFTVLWILARLRLFRQRNGVFLALGLVCLFGAGISLLQHTYSVLTSRLDTQTGRTTRVTSESDSDLPLLSEELELDASDVAKGRHGRMLRDWPVIIGNKRYLMKSGEIFPVEDVRDNNVTFRVDDVSGVVPAEVIEIAGPNQPPDSTAASSSPPQVPASPEDARLTQRAQQEAVRRYPALGVRGSPENELFLETYNDWKSSGSELLQDPEWPLLLADLLAKREGWERSESVAE